MSKIYFVLEATEGDRSIQLYSAPDTQLVRDAISQGCKRMATGFADDNSIRVVDNPDDIDPINGPEDLQTEDDVISVIDNWVWASIDESDEGGEN